MTSSTAWRIGVPGAIVSIAARSFGSRRGSSSEGERVKPSSVLRRSDFSFGSFGIESGLYRLTEGLRLDALQCAMTRRSLRGDDGREPELGAFLEAPVGLRGRAQAPGEADLAEAGGAGLHRPADRRLEECAK